MSADSRFPRLRRIVAAVAAAAMVPMAGCAAPDRAVLAASHCPEDAGVPPRPVAEPGTVYAWKPHSVALNVPGATPEPGRPVAGPHLVPGWTDVVSISSSGRTTFAVRADGTVWAYGLGHDGMLGDGDLTRHAVAVPQQVPGIDGARSVHVVGSAVFAVLADGTVMAWGDGLLAHGGRTGTVGQHVATPVPVPGLDDVVTISEGDLTAMALRSDGTVAGWGINVTEVLGDRPGTALTTVDGVAGVAGIASAGGAVVAVDGTGTVCAWGNNAHGLLGIEPVGGQTGRPVEVPGLPGTVQVAGGRDVAYALDEAGAVRAWGRGVSGALGDGNTSDHISAVPTVVEGLPPVRWIGAHGLTGFAVGTDGSLWGWGSSLGLGDVAPPGGAARPVRIPLPGPVLAVSGTHALLAPAPATPT